MGSSASSLSLHAAGAAALVLAALTLPGCAGESGAADAVGDGPAGSAVPSRAAPWRLAYASDVAGRAGLDVYVVDVPGGAPQRLAGQPGRDDFSPKWSPDGNAIVYRLNPSRGDEGEIMLVPAGGGKPRNLTRSPQVADWSPVWHPSGKTIAFFSFAQGRGDLWLMRRDGTLKRRLTRDGTLNEYATFSPDGTRVAFQSHRSGNFDIYARESDGRERNLTEHPGRDQWAAWSPDGRSIAFMSDRDGNDDVYVMRADGSAVRNLTRTPLLEESHPAWAPDGRLTFSRHGESGPIALWLIKPNGKGAQRLHTTAQPVFSFDWLKH